MKHILLVAIFALGAAGLGRSQTSTPPATADHAPVHAQHTEHGQAMCKQMMEEHVADMRATSQVLAANLAQLKSTLPMISDLNERSRWQANIAMWQALADHFKHMTQHAEHMQAMGMGCGMTIMGHGMSNHAGREHDMPATSSKPQ